MVNNDLIRQALEKKSKDGMPAFTKNQIADTVIAEDSFLGKKIKRAETLGVSRKQALNFYAYGSAGHMPEAKSKAGMLERMVGADSPTEKAFSFLSSPAKLGLESLSVIGQQTFKGEVDPATIERMKTAEESTGDIARVAFPIAAGIATAPLTGGASLAAIGTTLGASAFAGALGSATENITGVSSGQEDMTAGEIAGAAIKEGAIDAAIDGLFLGAGFAYKAAKPVLQARRVRKELETLNRAVGQIAQGNPQDIPKMKQALEMTDLNNIDTYTDLRDAFKAKIGPTVSVQDDIFENLAPEPQKIEKFTRVLTSGERSVQSNPVLKSFDDLEELYTVSNRPRDLVRIQALKDEALANGITAKQVNQLAREYGSDFRTFSAKGQPLTSVNAAAHEATRTELKEAARSLLPDSKGVRLLDEQLSSLYRAHELANKTAIAVNKATQKIRKRNVVERLVGTIVKLADKATFHAGRGAVQGLIHSNVGNKEMSSLHIEQFLRKNLDDFVKLGKKVEALPEKEGVKLVVDFTKKLEKQIDLDFGPVKTLKSSSFGENRLAGFSGPADDVVPMGKAGDVAGVSDDVLISKLTEKQRGFFDAGSPSEQSKAIDHLRLKYDLENNDAMLGAARGKVSDSVGTSKVTKENFNVLQSKAEQIKSSLPRSLNNATPQEVQAFKEWRHLNAELSNFQYKEVAIKHGENTAKQVIADSKIRKADPSVDSLRSKDIEMLTAEARESGSLEEFIGKMRGSSSQYGSYNPSLRQYVKPESVIVGDIKGLDPNTTITVYRGLDVKSAGGKKIRSGDYVTTDYNDALQYTDSPSKVISERVKLKDLISEFPDEIDITNPKTPVSYELIYSPAGKMKKVTDSYLSEIWNKANGK